MHKIHIYNRQHIEYMLQNVWKDPMQYGLNKFGAYDFEQKLSIENNIFIKDFKRNLVLHGKTYAEWEALFLLDDPAITPIDKQYSKEEYALIIARHAILTEVVPKIDGVNLPGTHIDTSYRLQLLNLAEFHLQILLRTYNQCVAETPWYIMTHALQAFGIHCVCDPDLDHGSRHLCYEPGLRRWVLNSSLPLTFQTHGHINYKMSHQLLTYVKTQLPLTVPKIDESLLPDLLNNESKLNCYLEIRFGHGFILEEMTVDGYDVYVDLFDHFFKWNEREQSDFRHVVLQPLQQCIDKLSPFISIPFKNADSISAATKLKQLLTTNQDNRLTPEEDHRYFKPAERNALRTNPILTQQTYALRFLIALKSPELYQELNFHLQNPLTAIASQQNAGSGTDNDNG